MKIPNKFFLAGAEWRVLEDDGMTDMGQCDPERYTIRLRKDLNEQARGATFTHELGHAIRYTLGQDEHSEVEVDAQGNLLHQFLIQFAKEQRGK